MSRKAISVWVAASFSGFAGAMIAVQSRLTGGLSTQIQNPYLAAAISFLGGFVLVSIAVVSSRSGRAGVSKIYGSLKEATLPWWALLGGVLGALFVFSQSLVTPLLGVALFTVGVVAGNVTGGLVVDAAGFGQSRQYVVSAQRIVGCALAVFAVLLTVFAEISGAERAVGQHWLLLIPVIAGLALSLQAVCNGKLRSVSSSAIAATFVSFMFGTVLLVIAATISVAIGGWPTSWPEEPMFYLSGVLGVVFIAVSAKLVGSTGVLILGMSNVAGQLLAAVLLEMVYPLRGGLTLGLIFGAALSLVAVAVVVVKRNTVDSPS